MQYMKVPCTFRIDSDVLQAIIAEAAELSEAEGRKVSQAEVIERAWNRYALGFRMPIMPAPDKSEEKLEQERIVAQVKAAVKPEQARPHMIHSGSHPIKGCEACAGLQRMLVK